MSGKAALVKELRQTLDENVILVDAGNLFFKQDNRQAPDLDIRDDIIKIGYDAVGIGSNDLSGGIVLLKTMKASGLPIISANVVDDKGSLLFEPFIIKQTGSEKVGIISITGDNGKSPGKNFQVKDWQGVLEQQLQKLSTQCSFIMLLSSLSADDNKKVASLFPQIKFIVSSYPKRANIPPQLVEDTLISQVTSRGKYLGKMDIVYSEHGSWASDEIAPGIEKVSNKIKAVQWQIMTTENQLSEADPMQARNLDKKIVRLRAYNSTLENELTSLKRRQQRSDQGGSEFPNKFQATFIPVHPVGSGTVVDTVLEKLRNETRELVRRTQNNSSNNQFRDKLLLTDFIAGNETCFDCHAKQTDFWRTTAHAKAFSTLLAKDKAEDPDCLPCHVNGGSITTSSSFTDRQLLTAIPSGRQGIGCENCHGPALNHSVDPTQNKPLMKTPPKELCLVCHTVEQDNNFEYITKLQKIACPSSN